MITIPTTSFPYVERFLDVLVKLNIIGHHMSTIQQTQDFDVIVLLCVDTFGGAP